MPSDNAPNANQDSRLSSDEKRWRKEKFGSEYAFLILHGLSIYNEDDRREGRAILRFLMHEANESNTSSAAADKAGKMRETNNQDRSTAEDDDGDSWVDEEYNENYRLGYSEDCLEDLRAEWKEKYGDDFGPEFGEEDYGQEHGEECEDDPWAYEFGDEDMESTTWLR